MLAGVLLCGFRPGTSALRLDLEQPVIVAVGDVEHAGGVDIDAMRLIQLGRQRRTVEPGTRRPFRCRPVE